MAEVEVSFANNLFFPPRSEQTHLERGAQGCAQLYFDYLQ